MRYVGSENDEFDDDDEELEDDDELDDDDDGGSSRPRSNPFTTGIGQPRSSALPGAGRSTVGGSGSSSSGLSSRLPGSPPGGGASPNRPGAPGSPSPGSSAAASPPRYGGTPGGGSGSSNPSSPAGGSRFGTPGSSSPQGGSGSSSGGSSPFSTRYTPGSSSSSSGSGQGSSSSPPRPGTPGSSPPPKSPGEEKKSGGVLGGLGGLGSRLGRGGDEKKDNKPAQGGGKPGEKSGPLSGLTSRFTGGGKQDSPKPGSGSKPGDSKTSGGGLFSRFTGGGKEDPKKTTGTTSSFKPGTPGAPGARTTGTTPSVSASSAPGAANRPVFGGAGGAKAPGATGARPAASKADAPTGLRRFLPFGGGREEKKPAPAKPRTNKTPRVEGSGLTLDNKLDILGVALVLGSLLLFLSNLSATKGALVQWVNTFLAQAFGWGAIAIPVSMLAVGIWLIARHFGEDAPVVPPNRIFGVILAYIGILLIMQYVDTYSYINNDGSAVSIESLQNVWLPISITRGSGGGWVGANLYFIMASNLTEYGAFLVAAGLLIVGAMFILSLSAAELAMIVMSIGRSFGDARQRRAQRRAAAQIATNPLEQLTAQAAAPVSPPIKVTRPEPAALPLSTPTPALPAGSEVALPEPARASERSISINIGGRSTSSPFNSGELVPVENAAPGQPMKMPGAPAKAPEKPAAAGGFGSRLRGALPGISLGGAKSPPAEAPGQPSAKPDSIKAQAATQEKAPEKPAAGMGTLRGLFNRQTTTAKPETPVEKPAAPLAKPGELAGSPPRSPVPASPAPTSATAASAAPLRSPVEEPARLGDLLKPAAPPSAKPLSPTPASVMDKRTSSEIKSPLGATKMAEPAKPFGAPVAGFKSPLKPEDILDDEDDEFDDLDDEFDEEEDRLSNLAPAKPKGTLPSPRPDSTPARVSPSPFGSNKPAESMSPADRQDRLNALRSGAPGQPGVKPEVAASSAPRPVSAPPATPGQPIRPAASAPMAPAAQAQPPSSSPASMPVRPAAVQPGQPAGVEKPTEGEKKAQPVAAFWKSPGESQKPAEPPKVEMPKAEAKPPAPSYGKPTNPPGVPISMSSAASVPAPAGNNMPLPPSPEIAVRPPGVGTSAPAGIKRRKEWKLPSYASLLMPGSEGDIDRESLLRRARIIEDTLQSFGAPGKVVEVNTGPVITQFGVEPDYLVTRGGKKNRVKVSAIAQLDKDMQLALGAKSIRIEAPVPGKGYVGVEVPNDTPSLVSLRDVMESDTFKKIKSPLAIALGQSVDGTPISADLTGMPHLLIAGTTGSGKSVCVNAIITSLIIQNPPDRVKFIMVDPKRVELTGYNGIPHLVAPVVVDLERIVGVLKWVTREMDERYKKFSNAGARNIDDYNNHLPADAEWMPYIVVIIDELADLMMLAPDETERVITRIAALARATGIHLVIATQRPSVDVVTGLIKANFPARIAFAVAGGVDSRVILDQPGAERLLGRGDMLYMSGDSPAPLRLQGVFVSDTEINNITRYWKSQMSDDDGASKPITTLVLDHSIVESSRSVSPSNERQQIQQAFWERDERAGNTTHQGGPRAGDDDDLPDDQEDDLYEEAVEMVRRLNKASVSLLQRRLRIGYTRAARLIDRMEEENIVGPAVEGSRPREVLPMKG